MQGRSQRQPLFRRMLLGLLLLRLRRFGAWESRLRHGSSEHKRSHNYPPNDFTRGALTRFPACFSCDLPRYNPTSLQKERGVPYPLKPDTQGSPRNENPTINLNRFACLNDPTKTRSFAEIRYQAEVFLYIDPVSSGRIL